MEKIYIMTLEALACSPLRSCGVAGGQINQCDEKIHDGTTYYPTIRGVVMASFA